MSRIDLVFDADCPHAGTARDRLRHALEAAGRPITWHEWERSRPDTPEALRLLPSPTILVEGQDVAGAGPPGDGRSCRLYWTADGRPSGAPPPEMIRDALDRSAGVRQSATSGAGARFKSLGAVLPAAGAALLPKLACPLCWPAYVALTGSLGLGFVDYTPYLLPVTVGLSVLALAAVGWLSARRHDWLPAAVAGAAVLAVGLGRFAWDSEAVAYAGVAALLASPFVGRSRRRRAACPSCLQAPVGRRPS